MAVNGEVGSQGLLSTVSYAHRHTGSGGEVFYE